MHHVGVFAVLEDQMSTFTSDLDRKRTKTSPDRVDALVWGLTELQIDPSGNTGMLDHYRQMYEKHVGKKDAPAATPAAPSATPASAAQPSPKPADALVTLICPRGSGNSVVGLSRKEYWPDAVGMIHVDAEDAPPLKRAGFVEVQLAVT